jgi:hypothetical protein
MAHKAGFTDGELAFMGDNFRRFEALVRADELVKPCCGNFAECQQVCMPRAAAQEREACAKVAEDSDHIVDGRGYHDQLGDANATARNIAAAIRNRGQA